MLTSVTPPTRASRLAEYRGRLAMHEAGRLADGERLVDVQLDLTRRTIRGIRLAAQIARRRPA
jgi:hypothetical protein